MLIRHFILHEEYICSTMYLIPSLACFLFATIAAEEYLVN